MQVSLVAIQPDMALADYASFGAFSHKISALMDEAMRDRDPALPALVAFPEYLGMYLGFVPWHWDLVRQESTMSGAVAKIAERCERRGGEAPRAAVQRALFGEHAVETERSYAEVFSGLSRQHDAYIAAGSLCVPALDESPHRGGRIVARDDGRIYNQSYLFSPRGLCLGRTAKIHVPPGEDQLIDGAPESSLVPVRTALGSVGTLLGYDGYHHRPVERHDAQGAEVVVQLCYFGHPDVRFDGRGKVVPRIGDFVSLLQGRESIRLGMASFLVGSVFEDKRAEGLSFIARNTGDPDARWEDAIVARAPDPRREAIVRASLELDRRA